MISFNKIALSIALVLCNTSVLYGMDIFRAIQDGECKKALGFIAAVPEGQRKAYVNQADYWGLSLLSLAAYKGQDKVVQALLDGGADANQPDKDGKAPLYWAAHNAGAHNCTEIVLALVAHGANVNQPDKDGKTSLHGLAECYTEANDNLVKGVQILLEKGANLDLQDRHGTTALHWAALNGNATLVQIFMHAGADANKTNNMGETPLQLAAACGRWAVVQTLLGFSMDIFEAVVHQDLASVQKILVSVPVGQRAVFVNQQDGSGDTPLDLAAYYDYPEVAQALIVSGADVNKANETGDTPLHLAADAVEGHEQIVTVLINAGADLKKTNVNGDTPLQLAIKKGNRAVIQILTNAMEKPRMRQEAAGVARSAEYGFERIETGMRMVAEASRLQMSAAQECGARSWFLQNTTPRTFNLRLLPTVATDLDRMRSWYAYPALARKFDPMKMHRLGADDDAVKKMCWLETKIKILELLPQEHRERVCLMSDKNFYHMFLLALHPDKIGQVLPEQRSQFENIMKNFNAAYCAVYR